MIRHFFNNLLWFVTGGQSDFFPLFKGWHLSPLMARLGGINVGPAMEVFICICLLGAAIFIGLTIRRCLDRRWFRAITSLIIAASMTTAAYAASSTLSALTAASSVGGTDLFYDVQTPGVGGVKATAAQLLAYIGTNISSYVSISAGCGNSTGAGAIQVGSINSQLVSNVQTGTNYGIQVSDCGGIVVLSHSSNTTPTIPEAGSTGFTSGWYTTVCNVNTGTQTITPAAGTIAGLSSFTLGAGTETGPVCVGIYSGSAVGTNDYGVIAGGSSGGGVTSVSNSDGSLIVVPTTGAVVVSLAVSNPNTWTVSQTFSTVFGTLSTQSSTPYTFKNTDCGTDVRFTDNSAVTATIPAYLPVGCHINVIQRGTAKVSVNGTAVGACTLTSPNSYTGTSGTAGSVIGIIVDTNSGGNSATCVLTGNGS